jgi:NAD+ synthase
LNHGIPVHEVAAATGLTDEQAQWVFNDIQAKRKATRYQQMFPLLVEPIDEVSHSPATSDRGA